MSTVREHSFPQKKHKEESYISCKLHLGFICHFQRDRFFKFRYREILDFCDLQVMFYISDLSLIQKIIFSYLAINKANSLF